MTKTILDLSATQARDYLMQGTAYCKIDLPPYFVFDSLLSSIAQSVGNRKWSDVYECQDVRSQDDVNYRLLSNKDGKYAWRQFELIHPVLYVLLVRGITASPSWEKICQQFRKFRQADDRIRCLSLPVVPQKTEKGKARQVYVWWREVEQRSIEYALDFEYMIRTDLVDCYPSVYTHSISWAIHGKAKSKENRHDRSLIGNVIDNFIQDMRHGQTNGIPQGSVLMDFIAEMVLGYADRLLACKLRNDGLKDYKILRYRDDYRIFTNSPLDGEKILKSLSEVMIDLGMKLHPQKTEVSDQVIWSSIKPDKRSRLSRKQSEKDLQKHLLIIHNHSTDHPNAGSLKPALTEFLDRLEEVGRYGRALPLISIAVDIAYRNPGTYPLVSAIVSKCLGYLDAESDKKLILEKIRKRFSGVANAGLMELWLQRICLHDNPIQFGERLCKLVAGEESGIWNSDWVKMKTVRRAVAAGRIVDQDRIDALPPVIERKEVELFPPRYR
ncbi:MAG: RNA-directed DNA polymerase [Bacteroidetes bacterium]|nr:RNA-directed DNA polymerase [Bacteroidota bacterium]